MQYMPIRLVDDKKRLFDMLFPTQVIKIQQHGQCATQISIQWMSGNVWDQIWIHARPYEPAIRS